MRSTLAGHLALKAGSIDQRHAEKLEREITLSGGHKDRKYAWLMDRRARERHLGTTLCVTRFRLQTKERDFTVFVTPGARSSVATAIPAIAQADVGVLVVDAHDEALETGLGKDGQSLEHALLAYTFGVKQLIVVINKLDSMRPRFSQEAYDKAHSAVARAIRKYEGRHNSFFCSQASSLLTLSHTGWATLTTRRFCQPRG